MKRSVIAVEINNINSQIIQLQAYCKHDFYHNSVQFIMKIQLLIIFCDGFMNETFLHFL